jgi:hypothetical protein
LGGTHRGERAVVAHARIRIREPIEVATRGSNNPWLRGIEPVFGTGAQIGEVAREVGACRTAAEHAEKRRET